MPIRFGYCHVNLDVTLSYGNIHFPVDTLTFLQAIANLPRVKHLQLRFKTHGSIKAQDRHIEEPFKILNNSVHSLMHIQENVFIGIMYHPELRNCSELVAI